MLFADYSDTTFMVAFEEESVSVTNPLTFNRTLVNPGNHYDASTGVYTVPVDGIYEFVLHVFGYGDVFFGAFISVDGQLVSVQKRIPKLLQQCKLLM